MEYLAYISIAFITFQFVNVVLNFIFSQKIHQNPLSANKKVSVLIPARNEENNIGFLLDDLGKIDSNNLEIIVYDDQSTDNTSNIVHQYANSDKRIELIHSGGLSRGWLGKNHACYHLAQKATGNFYLFVDADVRLRGKIIEDAASFLKKHKLGLLSVFPVQIQKTFGEKMTVPIMNYILLTLLPLIFVRVSPFSSHSAANGQFMLFNAEIYNKIQPHKIFRFSPVEDIAISRYLKREKIKIACVTGEDRIKCRMYKNYREALNGFAKNIFMFFGNNPVLAFIFWLIAALGFIPVLASQQKLLMIYLAAILMIQLLYSFTSKQNTVVNIFLFPLQLLFMFQVMIKSMINRIFKQHSWKGRNIYS